MYIFNLFLYDVSRFCFFADLLQELVQVGFLVLEELNFLLILRSLNLFSLLIPLFNGLDLRLEFLHLILELCLFVLSLLDCFF